MVELLSNPIPYNTASRDPSGVVKYKNKFWAVDKTNRIIYGANADGSGSVTVPLFSKNDNPRGMTTYKGNLAVVDDTGIGYLYNESGFVGQLPGTFTNSNSIATFHDKLIYTTRNSGNVLPAFPKPSDMTTDYTQISRAVPPTNTQIQLGPPVRKNVRIANAVPITTTLSKIGTNHTIRGLVVYADEVYVLDNTEHAIIRYRDGTRWDHSTTDLPDCYGLAVDDDGNLWTQSDTMFYKLSRQHYGFPSLETKTKNSINNDSKGLTIIKNSIFSLDNTSGDNYRFFRYDPPYATGMAGIRISGANTRFATHIGTNLVVAVGNTLKVYDSSRNNIYNYSLIVPSGQSLAGIYADDTHLYYLTSGSTTMTLYSVLLPTVGSFAITKPADAKITIARTDRYLGSARFTVSNLSFNKPAANTYMASMDADDDYLYSCDGRNSHIIRWSKDSTTSGDRGTEIDLNNFPANPSGGYLQYVAGLVVRPDTYVLGVLYRIQGSPDIGRILEFHRGAARTRNGAVRNDGDFIQSRNLGTGHEVPGAFTYHNGKYYILEYTDQTIYEYNSNWDNLTNPTTIITLPRSSGLEDWYDSLMSDGTYLWALDNQTDKVYCVDPTNRTRVSANDMNLPDHGTGRWFSSGAIIDNTMYLAAFHSAVQSLPIHRIRFKEQIIQPTRIEHAITSETHVNLAWYNNNLYTVKSNQLIRLDPDLSSQAGTSVQTLTGIDHVNALCFNGTNFVLGATSITDGSRTGTGVAIYSPSGTRVSAHLFRTHDAVGIIGLTFLGGNYYGIEQNSTQRILYHYTTNFDPNPIIILGARNAISSSITNDGTDLFINSGNKLLCFTTSGTRVPAKDILLNRTGRTSTSNASGMEYHDGTIYVLWNTDDTNYFDEYVLDTTRIYHYPQVRNLGVIDGKLAMNQFSGQTNLAYHRIALYNTDGTVSTTINSDLNGVNTAGACQLPDGKVWIVVNPDEIHEYSDATLSNKIRDFKTTSNHNTDGVALVGDKVYMTSQNTLGTGSVVYIYNLDGTSNSSVSVNGNWENGIAHDDNYVYLFSEDGTQLVLNKPSNNVVTSNTAVTGKDLFVPSIPNRVYEGMVRLGDNFYISILPTPRTPTISGPTSSTLITLPHFIEPAKKTTEQSREGDIFARIGDYYFLGKTDGNIIIRINTSNSITDDNYITLPSNTYCTGLHAEGDSLYVLTVSGTTQTIRIYELGDASTLRQTITVNGMGYMYLSKYGNDFYTRQTTGIARFTIPDLTATSATATILIPNVTNVSGLFFDGTHLYLYDATNRNLRAFTPSSTTLTRNTSADISLSSSRIPTDVRDISYSDGILNLYRDNNGTLESWEFDIHVRLGHAPITIPKLSTDIQQGNAYSDFAGVGFDNGRMYIAVAEKNKIISYNLNGGDRQDYLTTTTKDPWKIERDGDYTYTVWAEYENDAWNYGVAIYDGTTVQNTESERDVTHITERLRGMTRINDNYWIIGQPSGAVSQLIKLNLDFSIADRFSMGGHTYTNWDGLTHIGKYLVAFNNTDNTIHIFDSNAKTQTHVFPSGLPATQKATGIGYYRDKFYIVYDPSETATRFEVYSYDITNITNTLRNTNVTISDTLTGYHHDGDFTFQLRQRQEGVHTVTRFIKLNDKATTILDSQDHPVPSELPNDGKTYIEQLERITPAGDVTFDGSAPTDDTRYFYVIVKNINGVKRNVFLLLKESGDEAHPTYNILAARGDSTSGATVDTIDITAIKDKLYGLESDRITVYTNSVARGDQDQRTQSNSIDPKVNEKYVALVNDGRYLYMIPEGNTEYSTKVICIDPTLTTTDKRVRARDFLIPPTTPIKLAYYDMGSLTVVYQNGTTATLQTFSFLDWERETYTYSVSNNTRLAAEGNNYYTIAENQLWRIGIHSDNTKKLKEFPDARLSTPVYETPITLNNIGGAAGGLINNLSTNLFALDRRGNRYDIDLTSTTQNVTPIPTPFKNNEVVAFNGGCWNGTQYVTIENNGMVYVYNASWSPVLKKQLQYRDQDDNTQNLTQVRGITFYQDEYYVVTGTGVRVYDTDFEMVTTVMVSVGSQYQSFFNIGLVESIATDGTYFYMSRPANSPNRGNIVRFSISGETMTADAVLQHTSIDTTGGLLYIQGMVFFNDRLYAYTDESPDKLYPIKLFGNTTALRGVEFSDTLHTIEDSNIVKYDVEFKNPEKTPITVSNPIGFVKDGDTFYILDGRKIITPAGAEIDADIGIDWTDIAVCNSIFYLSAFGENRLFAYTTTGRTPHNDIFFGETINVHGVSYLDDYMRVILGNGQIRRYKTSTTTANPAGTGISTGTSNPTGLAVYGDDILVCDNATDSLYGFEGRSESPGTAISRYTRDLSDDNVDKPTGMDVDGNELYIINKANGSASNHRIYKYNVGQTLITIMLDLASKFRIETTNISRDISSKFRINSTLHARNLSSKFRINATLLMRDLSSKFRIRSKDPIRDISSKFRILETHISRDLSSLFRINATLHALDLSSKFRIQQTSIFRDILSKFRIGQYRRRRRTITSKFRIQATILMRDITSKFEIGGSSTLSRNLVSKFQIGTHFVSRNLSSLFRIQQTSIFRDISSLFRIRSHTIHVDLQSIFRILETTLIRDISTKFFALRNQRRQTQLEFILPNTIDNPRGLVMVAGTWYILQHGGGSTTSYIYGLKDEKIDDSLTIELPYDINNPGASNEEATALSHWQGNIYTLENITNGEIFWYSPATRALVSGPHAIKRYVPLEDMLTPTGLTIDDDGKTWIAVPNYERLASTTPIRYENEPRLYEFSTPTSEPFRYIVIPAGYTFVTHNDRWLITVNVVDRKVRVYNKSTMVEIPNRGFDLQPDSYQVRGIHCIGNVLFVGGLRNNRERLFAYSLNYLTHQVDLTTKFVIQPTILFRDLVSKFVMQSTIFGVHLMSKFRILTYPIHVDLSSKFKIGTTIQFFRDLKSTFIINSVILKRDLKSKFKIQRRRFPQIIDFFYMRQKIIRLVNKG